MNLTYRIDGKGYVIMNNGVDWIVQDSYMPYQGTTVEESAKNHIKQIVEDINKPIEPIKDEEIKKLKSQVSALENTILQMQGVI